MLHAARRWTSQMVTAMSSADSATESAARRWTWSSRHASEEHHGRPARSELRSPGRCHVPRTRRNDDRVKRPRAVDGAPAVTRDHLDCV